MPEVLFLCTGNSCRSQMAEGLARARWPEGWQARSAGIETHGLNPYAVEVMGEIGIDISGHTSKTVPELGSDYMPELVITVCGHAAETCPNFPAATRVIHRGFDDPPKIAVKLSGEARLDVYRRVRDEIDRFVSELPGSS